MTFTSLWKNFTCTGGECVNTCCAGWNIPVSKEDIQCFSSLPKIAYQEILKKIDTEKGFMYLCDGRCPFLTNENLCQIILDHGEEYPGVTCRTFPRQENHFGRHAECSVRSSCPCVVQELLKKERFTIETEDEIIEPGSDEKNKADSQGYLPYLRLRDYLIASFQAVDGYMSGKIWLLLQLVSDMNKIIKKDDLTLEAADDLINVYTGQYGIILNECEKAVQNHSRVVDTFVYFSKRFFRVTNRNKAEKYSPFLFSDISYWDRNRSDLKAALGKLSEVIHKKYPLFSENYFANEIFLNWNVSENDFLLENLYSSIAKWMLFYFIMLSAFFHGNMIDDLWLSKMVSDIDRDYSHNCETRHQIGKSIADSSNNNYCVPWIFPY